MHIISHKKIVEAKRLYSHCESALDGWYKVIKGNTFTSFSAMKQEIGRVDKVGDLYVFDIGGNKLRLIAAVHFNVQKVFIREILDHTEYDQGRWKQR